VSRGLCSRRPRDNPEVAVCHTLGTGPARAPLGRGIRRGLIPGTLIASLVIGEPVEVTAP